MARTRRKQAHPQRRVSKESLVGLVAHMATRGKHGRIKRAEEDIAKVRDWVKTHRGGGMSGLAAELMKGTLATSLLNNARVIQRDVSHIRENGIVTLLKDNIGGVTDAIMSAAPEALSCAVQSETNLGRVGCLAKTAYGLYASRLSSSAAPENKASEAFESKAAQSSVLPAENYGDNTAADLSAPPDS